MKTAMFSIGQIVRHRKFAYRGVIVDVDPVYQGTEEWYETVATSRPPKGAPWYRVLVDDAQTMTYVAERHLSALSDAQPIRHPKLAEYMSGQEDSGRYTARRTLN